MNERRSLQNIIMIDVRCRLFVAKALEPGPSSKQTISRSSKEFVLFPRQHFLGVAGSTANGTWIPNDPKFQGET